MEMEVEEEMSSDEETCPEEEMMKQLMELSGSGEVFTSPAIVQAGQSTSQHSHPHVGGEKVKIENCETLYHPHYGADGVQLESDICDTPYHPHVGGETGQVKIENCETPYLPHYGADGVQLESDICDYAYLPLDGAVQLESEIGDNQNELTKETEVNSPEETQVGEIQSSTATSNMLPFPEVEETQEIQSSMAFDFIVDETQEIQSSTATSNMLPFPEDSEDATKWVARKIVTEEISLRSNHLVCTELTIGMEYKISVEVIPTMFVEGIMGNVLCFRNQKTPRLFAGIWFHSKDKGKIQIDMKVNGKTSTHNTWPRYLPNRWHKLEVMQTLDNGAYIYSITINNELVYSAVNWNPEVFTGVNVYAAYNNPQTGFIRNFIVYSHADRVLDLTIPELTTTSSRSLSTTSPKSTTTSSRPLSTSVPLQTSMNATTGSDDATNWVAQKFVTEESCLRSDHLVGTELTIGMEYKISVEVKPTTFVEGIMGNVLCFRNENTPQLFGGIWFHSKDKGKIQIAMNINGKPSTHNTEPRYLPDRWYKLEVMQTLDNGSYIYSITINNELVYSTINRVPEVFTAVEVYAAYNNPQSGFIRNVIVCHADRVLDLSSPESTNTSCRLLSTSASQQNIPVHLQTSLNTTTGSDATNWVAQKYVTEERSLMGNHLVGTGLTIGMEYKISVEMRPAMRGYVKEILPNAVCFKNRFRLPQLFGGIWLNIKDIGKIQIAMNVNRKPFTHNTEPLYLPDRWHKVEVMQRMNNGSYVYTIRINNEVVYSAINHEPEVFTHVDVYAAHGLPRATTIYIRNFTVSAPEGTQLGEITEMVTGCPPSLSTMPAPTSKEIEKKERRKERQKAKIESERTGLYMQVNKGQRVEWTEKMFLEVKTFNPEMSGKEHNISHLLYLRISKARRRFWRTETRTYEEFLNSIKFKNLAVSSKGFQIGFDTYYLPCNEPYFRMLYDGWLKVAPPLGYWEAHKQSGRRMSQKSRKKKRRK